MTVDTRSATDRIRRRLLLGGFAFTAAGGLNLALAIRQVLAMSGKPIIPGFNLVEGDVRKNGVPAKLGDDVAVGDTITTGPASQAVVVIGEDALMIRADTTLRLEGQESTLVQLMRLATGAVVSVWGPRRFLDIKTPVTTIGIRGTAVYVESEPGRTYACTCYGQAELVPIASPGQAKVVRTQYHDLPHYIYARKDEPIVPAKVINHTDAELVMLEGLLKREPPFVNDPVYERGGY